MKMKNLLIGVACAGIAASIALGVRNQLKESQPAGIESVAPAGALPSAAPVAEPYTPDGSGAPDAPPPSDQAAGSGKSGSSDPDTPVSNTGTVPPAVSSDASRSNGATSPAVPAPGAQVGLNDQAASDQADGAAILRRAAAAYEKVQSMRADFTQVQDNPLLRRRITSRGTFFQQQPDKFLMRFSEPAGDKVVGDGRYFWIYYPSHDAKQVIQLPASVGQGVDLRAQFIGDPTKRFRHTLQGKEEVAGRSASVLTLVPVEPAGYRSLKVWIDDRDSLIRRFVLTNDNGVVQNFDLANLQVNPKLDPALFRFTPPAGATIVRR